MVHFLPAIKQLENTHPKNKAERSAKRRALKILYGEEVKEIRGKHKRRGSRRSSSGGAILSKKEKQTLVGFGRFLHRSGQQGVASYKQYRENVKARRLQKAHTIQKIRESNLPEATKQREISKLSGVASQTSAKSTFFKFQRTPRELRQSAEANF